MTTAIVMCDISFVYRGALQTLEKLCDSVDQREFSARIIHPLVRVLDTVPELRATAMNALAALVMQLGRKYAIFIPTVNKVNILP